MNLLELHRNRGPMMCLLRVGQGEGANLQLPGVTFGGRRLAARKSIIELEQLRNFPFDPSFFSLCVSGEWDLVYSTSRIGVPDSALKVRSIISNLDGQTKNLIHSVGWEYSEAADGDKPGRETMGVFEVKMKYNLSDVPSVPTRMIVGIEVQPLLPSCSCKTSSQQGNHVFPCFGIVSSQLWRQYPPCLGL